jgi:hypothetical protein
LAFVAIFAIGFMLAAASSSKAQDLEKSQSCELDPVNHQIKHMVFIQFDNVHFRRDNPTVPSDLEQMPHLLNFLKGKGTLFTNDHTVVISHTAAGFITTQNGVYPDRDGLGVSNSFRYYNGNQAQTTSSNSAFVYWTDRLNLGKNTAPNDTSYVQVDENGKNAPAPWVAYTRAGCRVGYFGMNGPVLESTSEIPNLFPSNSQAFQDFQNKDPDTATNYVGVAVHCPKGDNFCSSANGGISDILLDEPGGYTGYNEVLGNRYIAPQIGGTGAGNTTLDDFNGNPIGAVVGGNFVPGFNSTFNGLTPSISLAYAAAMQEHGIPVTYTYISDAHDNQNGSGGTFGPGEAAFVAQLKAYDKGFADFFASLKKHHITASNTLFVVTADEGDHFVGSSPTPSNCDGIKVPCTYSQIGEIDTEYPHFVGNTLPTGFGFHSDSAPATWVVGNPAPDDSAVRDAEQTLAAATVTDIYTGDIDNLFVAFADAPELTALHQASLGDPARIPTFIPFGNENYFFTSNACPSEPPYECIGAGFAWNHGDYQKPIAQVWLGIVGPGVQPQGENDTLWLDHTDVRPTMLTMLGLKDDYMHDGRVLTETFRATYLPASLIPPPSQITFVTLAKLYKQINAPFGAFGSTTLLGLATPGIAGTDESKYEVNENLIASFTTQRDKIAGQIRTLLENTEFGGQALDVAQANSLIGQARSMLSKLYSLTGGKISSLK